MLFNSYTYIALFLPLALVGYLALLRSPLPMRAVFAWLVLCSLVYYAWWNPVYLPLILGSVLVNYALGRAIASDRTASLRRGMLVAGIVANLTVLGYFKYAGFGVTLWNQASGSHIAIAPIVLPLALSFHTFQQIAYLVDAWRGEAKAYSLTGYVLFVTFFPQLIAGPIVHHKEMMPQFVARRDRAIDPEDLSVGSTLFVIGLFKKTVIADTIARFSSPVFDAAAAGAHPACVEAWVAALAYTLQIYFDFSGYSDMALGSARLFGIRLPQNFDSPYQATSIVEFWRRWHMTLSRFLRDYLYIPLGGNRRGPARRHVNLLITMLLGGLWHGAGWTFVAWGALHGIYLSINHAWNAALGQPDSAQPRRMWPLFAGGTLTFLSVVVAWVFFRAADFPTAGRMLMAMAWPDGPACALSPQRLQASALLIPTLLAVCWLLPNTNRLLAGFGSCFADPPARPASLPFALRWRPSTGWAMVISALAISGVLGITKASEFLYYQF